MRSAPLTLINDVGTASPPLFLVDVIEGLHEAMEGDDQAFFSFEFTGKEGVLYRFGRPGRPTGRRGALAPGAKVSRTDSASKGFPADRASGDPYTLPDRCGPKG